MNSKHHYPTAKTREVLGFREEHDWRKYVPLN